MCQPGLSVKVQCADTSFGTGKGHCLIGHFSSLTRRPFSLYFNCGRKERENLGQTMVSVNESAAHLTGLLMGPSIGQAFRFMSSPHFGTVRLSLCSWIGTGLVLA